MGIERRMNRSSVPHEAAGLYLDAMAQRGRMRALALATQDGLLVAGTGSDCEALAAIGVAQGSQVPVRKELLESVVGKERLHTSRLEIGGEIFFLASIGPHKSQMSDATVALRRILGPALSVPLGC